MAVSKSKRYPVFLQHILNLKFATYNKYHILNRIFLSPKDIEVAKQLLSVLRRK